MKASNTSRNVTIQQSLRAANNKRAQRGQPFRGVETLEARQLFSVTGFSLVDQSSFPGGITTVTNQPTVFHDTLQKTWLQLNGGQLKINGQTLDQTIASAIQKGEQSQGLSAYAISSSFDGTPSYSGMLKQTSSGPVLQLTFDAKGNETTFNSTLPSIFGPKVQIRGPFDPCFHVFYDLDFKVDLSLPTNLDTGKVTATATATTANVSTTTANVLVGIADAFGANITQQITATINGHQQDISSIVPTGLLNSALQLEAGQGYTHLISTLNSSGNLVLTAMKPTLTVNGGRNDQITISSGSKGSVVVTAGGKSQTFDAGLLKSIIVNGGGTNAVNIPSLPAGMTVQVNDSGSNTDTVVVGGNGSLDSVAGTVSVNSASSSSTNLTVDDSKDSAESDLTVTSKAVEFKGRDVVTYGTAGKGKMTLTVEGGSHGSNIKVLGTASGVATTIQTEKGNGNNVTISGSSSAVNVIGDGGTVTVGNGSLAAIGGTVDVNNFGNVVIKDYNDTVSRTVDLASTSGLLVSSSAVAFDGFSTVKVGFVLGVTVEDGNADNTFDAEGSPLKDFFTIDGHLGDILTGPAAAQVKFIETIRPITLPIPLPIMP